MAMDMETDELASRAEIDTRSPFRSVKEAVILFGEKVLAGEISNRLNEMQVMANKEQSASRVSLLIAELEETRQNLERAQEERLEMVNYLSCLRQELEKTKIEVMQLKAKEREKPCIDSDIEDIKFVEHPCTVEIERTVEKEAETFHRKKFVTFANPPSSSRAMSTEEHVISRQISEDRETSQMRNKKKKTKKKSLLPIMASILLKKKSYEGEASVQAHV
ncbi:hypothetical protein HPP92_021806 [Vanilla planifolia]|uniref:WEB family protein n=1 Tax=Vanilla planifolia TaxID=51239 RepID=A0A835PVU7_VANPL|nr:hypothetical protein HPP92_022114 [Vanilla planifolia]KAG0458678.1 hypothetical protein HPP92_021806 [Vanilla planifolia]